MTASPRRNRAPVSESDLLAYVDGRLDPARQAEVEAHLIAHPEDAHRVAADLALQEGLRVLFGRPTRAAKRKRAAWLQSLVLAAMGFAGGWWAAVGLALR
ncbi:MAG: anti-sigma factor family protein [Solirubrobacterales bacterium]